MKPLIVLTLLLFFVLNGVGQQIDYPDSGFTNKVEAKNLTVNGLKEGKWCEYFKYRYASVLTYVGDTAFKYYSLTVYKAGKPYGIVRWYYVSGKLQSKAPYENGEMNGIETIYYQDGELNAEIPYLNGEESGMVKIYYKNGNLKWNGQYTRDTANGIEKEYYEDGKLKSEIIYTNGVMETAKHYNENGTEIK